MKKQQPKKPIGISFQVHEITERHSPHTGIIVFDTKLRFYSTDEMLTIRGKYWPVGAKVDFRELPPQPR